MSRMQGKTVSPQLATGEVYVGIDVSKLYLDVHVHPTDQPLRVNNDKAGLQRLVRFLNAHGGPSGARLIVLEATGSYHRLPHRHLHAAGFAVAVMNPDLKRIEFDISPSHLFGLSASVVNFNRFPELLTAFCRGVGAATTWHVFDYQGVLDFSDVPS